jgi:hypothetical protein
MAVPLALQVTPQALVFALLPFQFGDQVFALRRGPAGYDPLNRHPKP